MAEDCRESQQQEHHSSAVGHCVGSEPGAREYVATVARDGDTSWKEEKKCDNHQDSCTRGSDHTLIVYYM